MDESKIKNGAGVTDDQTTIISGQEEGEQNEETVAMAHEETNNDRTTVLFNLEDINRKLEDEIANIPEVEEELTTAGLSKVLGTLFPGKSEAEKLRINRNFLRDAEPFRLERLLQDVGNTAEGLLTGFDSLDQSITIPGTGVTVIASPPKHGKSIFMMNLLLNMTRKYEDKHFLFYTYEEPRRNIEIKLINMSGDRPFPGLGDKISNLGWWRHELRTLDIDTLIKKSENDRSYRGLKGMLEIARRIHVVDSNYHTVDLVDSIKSFNDAFDLGAVFIDYFQKIRPPGTSSNLSRQQRLQESAEDLRKIADMMKCPLVCGAQLPAVGKGKPEYDALLETRRQEVRELEQAASLIIGLQNYSKSKFLGSDIYDNFSSRFCDHPLNRAEKMPEIFINRNARTIIRVKVLANREGSEPEVELLFHQGLLKLGDLENENLQQ